MIIPKYFEGKEILVTGATGLMGKALVEKFLRCCPGISKIYVIIRSRRGKSPKDRWAATTESHIFDHLRKHSPESLDKVVVLSGNGVDDNFGLNEAETKMLIENVNLIYHGAASINFFNDISTSVKTNLKSTYSLLEIAKQMKKLECFTHLSTAYSNFDIHGAIKEEVYDQNLEWRTLLELVEKEKYTESLQHLEPRLLKGHLTTYTLTKALAEVAVREYSQFFPAIIIRPVLVTGTYKDPVPGWMDVDNFVSLYARGIRMGVIRLLPNLRTTTLEMIPLDVSINGIIVATWERSLRSANGVEVYCHRLIDEYRPNFGEVKRTSMMLSERFAMPSTLWYNIAIFAHQKVLFSILFFFLQVLPGFFIDEALKLSGQKPRLKKIYTSLWRYNDLAWYYNSPHHSFVSEKFVELKNLVPKEDNEQFSLDYSNFDKIANLEQTVLNVLKYSWKENIDDVKLMEKSRTRYRMLTILHYTLCTIGLLILLCVIWNFGGDTVVPRLLDTPI